MHNLYCLAPDLESTKNIIQELQELGILNENIYVVANDHEMVKRENLHEAEIEDTTDMYDAFKRGILVGGVMGIVGGIAFAGLAPEEISAGVSIVLVVAMLGAALGAWVSAMIGISVMDPGVEKFEKEIDDGKLLIMADLPIDDEIHVKQKIMAHHPGVSVEGTIVF